MRVASSSLGAALLLLGAAVAHGAEPAGGALDQTRQELRQLQSDQKGKAGQTSDKARLSAPTLEVQPGSGSAESWLVNKQAKERKLREGRVSENPNWLAEGVEKLEKEETQAKAPEASLAKEPTTKEGALRPIDQSDSQYLLKLFDEQKKAGDPKPGATKTSAASPDPFAPFMENWLGSSPARGQFFDQFARKADAAPANLPAGGPADYRRQTNSAVASMAAPEPVVVEKSNPYLADLGAPILSREMINETSQLQPAMGLPGPAPEASRGGPVLPPSTSPAQDGRERAKAPLPGLTDDKKYFPQLKKF